MVKEKIAEAFPFVINATVIVVMPLVIFFSYFLGNERKTSQDSAIGQMFTLWPYAVQWNTETKEEKKTNDIDNQHSRVFLEVQLDEHHFQCLLNKPWRIIESSTSCLAHRSLNILRKRTLTKFGLKQVSSREIIFEYEGERFSIEHLKLRLVAAKEIRSYALECLGDFYPIYRSGKMQSACLLTSCGGENEFACLKNDQIFEVELNSCHEDLAGNFTLDDYFFCQNGLKPYCTGGADLICL